MARDRRRPIALSYFRENLRPAFRWLASISCHRFTTLPQARLLAGPRSQ